MTHTAHLVAAALFALTVTAVAQEQSTVDGDTKKHADDFSARLADPDPAKRAAAATALGGLYPESAAATPILLELVDDEDPTVRHAALQSIGALAARGLDDVATYLASLRSDKTKRATFMAAVRKVNDLGPAVMAENLVAELEFADAKDPTERGRAAAIIIHLACVGQRGSSGDDAPLEVAALALRSPDATTRRTALSALAVLARAALLHRRTLGERVPLPDVDDATPTARSAALLRPTAGENPEFRRLMNSYVPDLLVSTYGHIDEALLAQLRRMAENDARLALDRVDLLDLGGRGRGDADLVSDVETCTRRPSRWLVAALASRDPIDSDSMERLRSALASPSHYVRLTAGAALTQVAPNDDAARQLLLDELHAALPRYTGSDWQEDMQREVTAAYCGDWLARLPKRPTTLAELLYSWWPTAAASDGEARSAMIDALAVAIRDDAAVATKVRDALRKPATDDTPADELGLPVGVTEGVARAGAADGVIVQEALAILEHELDEGRRHRSRDQKLAWSLRRPSWALRLLAIIGPEAAAAAPTVERCTASDDALVRYLAHVALRRIRDD